MRDDITTEIASCRDCQRYTAARVGFHPARSVTAERPGDHFQIDLAQLPTSVDGCMYCLVLVDVFTGFVMLRPLQKKDAATVARAVWEICCIIGLPKILQSDNGTEFSNAIANTLCRLTGIERRFITAYNPRADGKVERTIKTIKETIVKLLHGASALWPLYVPFVQLMYNIKVQQLTGSSPFSLMFARQLNEMKDYSKLPAQSIDVDAWKEHQEKVVSLILPSISDRIRGRQEAACKKLDALRKKVTADELAPGSVVMIKDPAYLLHPSMRPSTEPEWIGPYTIIRRTRMGPYVLRDDTGEVYGRHVNFDHMKVVYGANKTHATTHNTESDDDDDDGGQQSYVVDFIVDHKEVDGEFKYKVRWKGYSAKDDTWERQDNFNDPQPVERYWKLQMMKKQAASSVGGSRTTHRGRSTSSISTVLTTMGSIQQRSAAHL